jgi:hypothetical protein
MSLISFAILAKRTKYVVEFFSTTNTHRRSYAIPKYINILTWEIKGKLKISFTVTQALTQCPHSRVTDAYTTKTVGLWLIRATCLLLGFLQWMKNTIFCNVTLCNLKQSY